MSLASRLTASSLATGSFALALASCFASEPSRDYAATWQRALGPAAPKEEARAEGARAPAAPSVARLHDAAGPLELSVEQALLLAVHENPSLRLQQLTTDVVGAYEAVERGVFDPELFARASYARASASETTDVTGERFSVRSNADSVEAGVRQRLPTGTAVELSASRDRSVSSRRPEQYEARVGLTVTQAILQGFGPAVNLAEVRIAEAATLASAWELRGFIEALLAETERAYWMHALAVRRVAIVEGSLEVTAQQLGEIEQFIAVGKLAPIDAAALQAEVALRKQDLIDARSELSASRLRLLRFLGADLRGDRGRGVVAITEPALRPAPIDDVGERLALARRLRADLNEARLRVEQQRLQTVMTKNGLLPRLDLFVTLGKSGYADSFGGSIEDIDGDSYDFIAGLELSQALGNRTASGLHRVARLERRVARAAVENLEQLVELDVRLAASELERARLQLDASAATRALREKTVAAEAERLRVGASTALQLAQAQRDLLASELAEVETMIGYRLALTELYRAEGSLLERRGIRIGWTEPGSVIGE